jgi:hypothetical protein
LDDYEYLKDSKITPKLECNFYTKHYSVSDLLNLDYAIGFAMKA